jgi:hypothetical protein
MSCKNCDCYSCTYARKGLQCARCGARFVSTMPTYAKFCSARCRVAAHRALRGRAGEARKRREKQAESERLLRAGSRVGAMTPGEYHEDVDALWRQLGARRGSS